MFPAQLGMKSMNVEAVCLNIILMSYNFILASGSDYLKYYLFLKWDFYIEAPITFYNPSLSLLVDGTQNRIFWQSVSLQQWNAQRIDRSSQIQVSRWLRRRLARYWAYWGSWRRATRFHNDYHLATLFVSGESKKSQGRVNLCTAVIQYWYMIN